MHEPVFERTEVGKLSLLFFGVCDTCPQDRDCEPMRTKCPVGLARQTLASFSGKNLRVVADFDFDDVQLAPQELDAKRAEVQEIFRFIPTLCNRCMFHVDRCFLNIIYMLVEHALHGEYRKRPGDRPIDMKDDRG